MADPLTDREITLIEQLGTFKHLIEIQNDIMLCLAVRLGGSVTINNAERDYAHKTYRMEKHIRVGDLTADIAIRAHLK